MLNILLIQYNRSTLCWVNSLDINGVYCKTLWCIGRDVSFLESMQNHLWNYVFHLWNVLNPAWDILVLLFYWSEYYNSQDGSVSAELNPQLKSGKIAEKLVIWLFREGERTVFRLTISLSVCSLFYKTIVGGIGDPCPWFLLVYTRTPWTACVNFPARSGRVSWLLRRVPPCNG